MYANFKQITPQDIFITAKIVAPAEDAKPEEKYSNCYNKTGIDFFDAFIDNIHRYGIRTARFQAARLGITRTELCFTIQTLSGISYTDFTNGYLILMAKEVFKDKPSNLKKASLLLGYKSYSGFYRFITKNMKEKPSWITP